MWFQPIVYLRLIISALLQVLGASSVLVGLPVFVSQSIHSILDHGSYLFKDTIQIWKTFFHHMQYKWNETNVNIT